MRVAVTEMTKQTKALSSEEQNKIIEENLALVGSVVKRFVYTGHDTEDLFQIGALGLIKAVQRFDDTYGVKLSTYAVPVIVGEIKRFLRDDGAVRISRRIKTNAIHIRAYTETKTKEDGVAPSIFEIADALGLEVEDVTVAMEAMRPLQSLQAESDEAPNLLETLPAADTQENLIDCLSLRQAIETLSERDRRLIYMRYFENKTQSDVAGQLGISQVQVSRIEKKLLLTLRAQIG